MPFKSTSQRAWMFMHHPEMAKRWAKHTPKGKKLPKHVGEDLLPGGHGDDRDPAEFDPRELKLGMSHEREHTDDPAKALEIAIDHLVDDPSYYSDMEAARRLFTSEGWAMDQYAPTAYQDMEWQRKWAPDEEPLPPLGEMFGLSMDDDEMRDDDVRQEQSPEDVPDILSPRMFYGWTARRAT